MDQRAKKRTNIRSDDWKTIGRHLKKRKGRQSIVYLDGEALSAEKVKRGVYRNQPNTLERLQTDSCPPLPEGVTINTPPQSPAQPPDGLYSLPLDLPSFLFRLPSDSLLSSKAVRNPESDRSTSSSDTLEFVRSILPFKQRDDFMSPDYLQAVCNELRKTVPERFNGELELIVDRLLEPELEQIVRFAAERSINKHFSFEDMQRLLILVETTGCGNYVLSCLEAGGKATKYLATEILKAAFLNNNKHYILLALDHGGDPNCNIQGHTPLNLATQKPGMFQLIPILFHAGAEPECWDIFRVAESGDIGLIELLVPRGGWPYLDKLVEIAARRGDVELFCSLIKLGSIHNQWSTRTEKNRPLHLALLGHHFEFAQLLIINFKPLSDNRLEHFTSVIERGDTLAAEFLIELGADVNAVMLGRLETALSYSVRNGRQDMIQLLLRHGADPYGPGFRPQRQVTGPDIGYIQTAFEDAVRSGSIEATQLLLSMGAKVKQSDTISIPLGLAVKNSTHLIPVLLRAGANISNMFEFRLGSKTCRATMLEVAVESAIVKGSLDVVETVLRLGAPVNRAIPEDDTPSALQLAVAQHTEYKELGYLSEVLTVNLVQLLLRWGADIHVPEFSSFIPAKYRECGVCEEFQAVRMTLVQCAAAQGRTALVKLLVGAGADANAPAGDKGFTAIQAAAWSGNAEMIDCLVQSGACVNTPPSSSCDLPALIAAVVKGNLESVSSLLQAGADPNTPGMVAIYGIMREMTPLKTASCQPENLGALNDDPKLRLKMLKLLLSAGASSRTLGYTDTRRDRSPLAWTVFYNDVDSVKVLLDYGAHSDIPGALRTAQDCRCKLEIWYLLGAICCEDAKRSRDTSTCRCDDFQIQMSVVRTSSDPHTGNDINMHKLLKTGQDAFPCCLHSASLQGNFAKVDHLLNHGANANIECSNTGMTALQIAVENGYSTIVQRLIQAGADTNAKRSNTGITELLVAALKGYVTVAHRLIQADADPALALQYAQSHGGLDICQLLQVPDSGG